MKVRTDVDTSHTLLRLLNEARREADEMRKRLEKDERIELRGFGSFAVRRYGAYKGRNPKPGKLVDVPAKRLPYFKVGKELKEKVNI